jgi:hypothetical protein
MANVSEPPPTFSPPASTSSVSRKLRRKSRRKQTQRVYSLGIPVACFLVFFGVIAAIMLSGTAELKGTLKGSRVGEMQFPPGSVSLARLHLSDGEKTQAAVAFEGSPESFVSNQMTCIVTLNRDDLKVDVRTGDGFTWYAVQPGSNVALTDWVRKNRVAINQYRLDEMAKAGTELCKDKMLKESGTPVVFDAGRYRDNFALNTQVNALGYVVEAVSGTRRTPCAYEDGNGTLYFILPHDVSSFQIRGREIAGRSLFPGEYAVQLNGIAPAAQPAVEAKPMSDDVDGETSKGKAPGDSEPAMDKPPGETMEENDEPAEKSMQ